MPKAHSISELEHSVYSAGLKRAEMLRAKGTPGEGVVHTPPEVASLLVRLTDDALRAHLGLEDGLGSANNLIVDPAVGTGAFPAAILSRCNLRGSLLTLDSDSAVEALFPALLHAKLEGSPGSWKHISANALSYPSLATETGPLVILGNPPWKSRSASRGLPSSEATLSAYRQDAKGERLAEARLGVLSDDYIRFWAWAQSLVSSHPQGGAVAFITNDSFLRGPVYRGMRRSLATTFSSLSVVSLGGNTLTARASRDQNVFGVRPGVAITVGVLKPKQARRERPRYASLKGTKAEKLRACLEPVSFLPLPAPESTPHFLLEPHQAPLGYWDEWVAIDRLFPFSGEGIQTNRDQALISTCRRELAQRVVAFLHGERTDGDLSLHRERRHYIPDKVRARLAPYQSAVNDDIETLAFRPFDIRFVYTRSPLCHRPRPRLRRAILHSEFCLLTVRKDIGDKGWNHLAVADTIPDACYFSSRSGCRTRAFPTHTENGEPNLSTRAAMHLRGESSAASPAREVFAYAIAILHSDAYKEACGAALRVDFPRLPRCTSEAFWRALVARGEVLILASLEPERARSLSPHRIGHRTVTRAPSVMSEPCPETEEMVRRLMQTG